MREYQIDIENSARNCKSVENCEKIIKEFLFGISDEIRFSQVRWGLIFKKGGRRDRRFRKILEHLSSSFIKDEVEEAHEGELENFLENKSHYFHYRLTPQIKAALREEHLLFGANYFEFSKNFYGFEDPTFLKDSFVTGKIISHECYAFLFLNPEEKALLKKQGIEFF